jgi:methionyl-tRNA synthetase
MILKIVGKMQKELRMSEIENKDQIGISDFAKVELKVADIIEAERVEGTDKLMRLQLDVGDETRQIVAGIAQHYEATDLIGKQVAVVTNLKPAKLRGVESDGMLLAASNDEDGIVILTPEKKIRSGSQVR